jgi:hypothetical protein
VDRPQWTPHRPYRRDRHRFLRARWLVGLLLLGAAIAMLAGTLSIAKSWSQSSSLMRGARPAASRG